MRTNDIEKGKKGEFVAKLCLLRIMDMARRQQGLRRSEPITVMSFLKRLIKDTFHEHLLTHINPSILTSLINFTHIVGLDDGREIDVTLAEQGMRKCAGFATKPGQWGIDMLLPILDTTDRASFVLVQVKNRRDAVGPAEQRTILDKMKPSFWDREGRLAAATGSDSDSGNGGDRGRGRDDGAMLRVLVLLRDGQEQEQQQDARYDTHQADDVVVVHGLVSVLPSDDEDHLRTILTEYYINAGMDHCGTMSTVEDM